MKERKTRTCRFIQIYLIPPPAAFFCFAKNKSVLHGYNSVRLHEKLALVIYC